MALDVLSIPAMAAEPERVFSGAKLIVMSQRHRLGDDVVNSIMCMRSWLRHRLITIPRGVAEGELESYFELDDVLDG